MRSIRFQFFSFLFLLLLVLLILLNTYPITSSRNLVFQEKQSSMTGQAAVVSASLSGLGELTRAGVQEVLQSLELTGYSRVSVVDTNGQTVYDEGDVSGGGGEELLTALGGKTVFRSGFSAEAFTSCAATPVAASSGIIGAVCLCEYDSERAALIMNVQRQVRILSLLVSVIAVAIAWIFSYVLIRRINELAESMRVVAGGDYSYRLTTRGRDELTHLGDEFNRLTQCLSDNEQQRRRFVSDASHELKTPLASIRLLSDSIVQNEMDADTMREFVTDIGNEAERLQRTTEKLLDLSRLDDDIRIIPEPVDVKQVAMDALSVLRPLAEERDVTVESDMDEGCVVMATADDMFHIVFNLLENAVKYNVPDGQVTLSVRSDSEKVEIAVSDTGIGIPEEDRLNIFSRFYRVDKARSRENGGSGLGLSIVHDCVLAHGGEITVGQNKPRGSRFIVTFPRPTSEETGI